MSKSSQVKLNKLYQSILQSQWAIDYQYALNFAPLVTRLLDPDKQAFDQAAEEKPEAIITYMDENGGRYSHNYKDPENLPSNSVAVIELIGAFTKYGGRCNYGTDEVAAIINMALANKKVIGAVLVVDSGGGAVNAVPPLMESLSARTKPMVAFCDTCGSAAYWTAAHCDYIMASNTISAAFGSIGVMFSLADVRPKLEKDGYKIHTIYAPESQHKNEAFELLLQGKYDMIKNEMMSPLARKFQASVRAFRGARLKEEVTGVLTGKMFYAEQAIEVGLADAIGNLQSAQEKVRELAEDKKFMLRLAVSATA